MLELKINSFRDLSLEIVADINDSFKGMFATDVYENYTTNKDCQASQVPLDC